MIDVSELPQSGAAAVDDDPEPTAVPFLPLPGDLPVPEGALAPSAAAPGRVTESTPSEPSPPPAASFQALDDDLRFIPPDTHGAVSETHVMTVLNSQVRIQTRTGEILTTVALDGFWEPLGAPRAFDPKVLYNGRQFVFTATANSGSAASSLLIGLSQTNDPTGEWNLFRIDADPDDQAWADYPSIGFNAHNAVVSVNMFSVATNGFVRPDIYVFPWDELSVGGDADHTVFRGIATGTAYQHTGSTYVPAITYGDRTETIYLVQTWSSAGGLLRVSSISAVGDGGDEDGGTRTQVLTPGVSFPQSPEPWTQNHPIINGGFAPQRDTATRIMNNDTRIQNVVYRNGSLWATHNVFLPAGAPTRTAVQWWELDPTVTTGLTTAPRQRARIDDPTGQVFRAFPSLAVNRNNDVLIGYSRFSATTYASGAYAFRSGEDPLNTLRDEVVLKEGEATYTKAGANGQVRWGDYSSTVVDPVNDLDMWTIQEYADSLVVLPSGTAFSRWATWWGQVVVPQPDTTPPICYLISLEPGPPITGGIEIRDTGGLASIEVIRQRNVEVHVPDFPAGTTDPVVVTVTLDDRHRRGSFKLRLADVAGNVSTCAAVPYWPGWVYAQP